MENNSIKREYTAFSAHGWRNWQTNEPMISLNVSDGRNEATQFLTLEQAEEVITLIEQSMAEAKALPEHEAKDLWDEETPF
jgi:hypothetical protein